MSPTSVEPQNMTHVQQSVIPHLTNQMAQMQLSSGGVRHFSPISSSVVKFFLQECGSYVPHTRNSFSVLSCIKITTPKEAEISPLAQGI